LLPGDVVYADIAQLPRTHDGHEYLLVIVDGFTMFVILTPLINTDAETIAKVFLDFWCDFGVSKVLHTDNASTFQNTILRALAWLHGCRQRFAVQYLPQTSPAEPVIHNVKQRIVRTLQGCEKEWPLYCKAMQLYINMQIKEKHGSTPYSLMFGRAPNDLTDYTKEGLNLLEDVAAWKQHQEKVVALVYPAIELRVRKYSERYIKRLDELRAPLLKDNLPPGTPVMIMNPLYVNENKHKRPMAEPTYLPEIHYVVRREPNGAYRVNDETGKTLDRNVPLSQMKILRARNIPKMSESDVYVVENIVGRRGTNPRDALYKVHWKNYPSSEDTWEPYDNMLDKTMVQRYNAAHPFR
jgi:hypothetical protein